MSETQNPTGRRRGFRAWKAAAVCAAGLLALSGCGLQPATTKAPEVGPGSLQPVAGAQGQQLVVTSKNYTEQLILSKIAVITAEAAGFTTVDMANVPGSQQVRRLMLSGKTDMFYEYTGSAWLTYMGHEEGIKDQQKQWEAVRDADAQNGLTWGPAAPMNNTYAFAVREDFAQKYGITSMSQIKEKVPASERKFCVETEFNSRQDGLGPMLKTYGIPRGQADGVPDDQVSIMDAGSIYAATSQGDCAFGEVFTTDGRIPALHLKVLEDDRHFFPNYNVAPVINSEFLAKYPELMDRFNQVDQYIDNETLMQLNYQVDVEGKDPGEVAKDWMVSKGLVSEKK